MSGADDRLHESLVLIDKLVARLMTLEGATLDSPDETTPLIEEAGAWLERAESEGWK